MTIETYHPLCARLGLEVDQLPYTPNWSAAPDFLELIVDHALATKPATIIECGSGMTTLMLARCCALNGRGHLYSLENGADYAANTRAAIAAYGLQDFSTVLHTPLIHYTVSALNYQWYDLADLMADKIDMLVIDGPPGFLQRHSRYPALPLLFKRLHKGSVVFMDDAARPDERELVAMWLEHYPDAIHRFVDNERGCSIIQLGVE